jgi:hypothetical protein
VAERRTARRAAENDLTFSIFNPLAFARHAIYPQIPLYHRKFDLMIFNRDEGDERDGGKGSPKSKVQSPKGNFPVYPCFTLLSDFIPCIPFIPVKSAFVFCLWVVATGTPQVPGTLFAQVPGPGFGFQLQTSNFKLQTFPTSRT